jgi:hypothetical protein
MYGSKRDPQGGMLRHASHHKAIRTAIMNATEFFDPLSWCSTVMDYTHRGMTKELYRLVAIDDVASAPSKGTEHQYMTGLWSHDICAGLL